MNVPAFVDISETEQTEKIRSYLKSLGGEISEENSPTGGLEVDLRHIIEHCHCCFKEQNEAEVESVLNGIVSLLVAVHPDHSESLFIAFCEKLMKAPNVKLANVCLRVLNNLYLSLDERSPLRYSVYYSLVKVAGQTENINAVFNDIDKVKHWLQQCGTSTDKVQRLLRLLHEVLLDCKQSDQASKVMVNLLGTYTEDNASEAREDAHRCIVASLGDPNTYLLDHLLTLKPVKFLEGELIHDLLTIFVSDNLAAYNQFYSTNKDFVNSLALQHEANVKKMRLLNFMRLAENEKEISFDVLQKELQLSSDDVEMFLIDALKTKLVRAKIDHFNNKVIVQSAMHRTFGRAQWQYLREVLNQWKQRVLLVQQNLESVVNARFEHMAAGQV
ncbi:Tango7p [Chamberlinius hualienensis]